MKANNPITIDGQVYDQLSINLAISYKVIDANNGDASVAMRIVPTRIDDNGEVITADTQAIGQAVASLNDIDGAEKIAADAVFSAIQSYLAAKGI